VKKVLLKIKPPHPGDVLREDFLKPLGLSANALALAIRIPSSRIGEIINARRSITAETAMRLSRYFGGSAEFWLGMQAWHDLAIAEDAKAAIIDREVQPRELTTA
jgi:addiction module HigA family antidote